MKLAPIFNHHMVFAANKPILIWGQGRGEITVRFAEFEQTVKAQNGMFFAAFRPMPYSGPHMLMVSSEDEEIILFDIFVGEVYVFAGQSNMQFKLGESNYPRDHYESNSALRLFSTRRLEQGEPFTPEECAAVIAQINAYGDYCQKQFGTRLFYPADEFYIKAGLQLPDDDFYGEYSQIENGVGLLRDLQSSVEFELEDLRRTPIFADRARFRLRRDMRLTSIF